MREGVGGAEEKPASIHGVEITGKFETLRNLCYGAVIFREAGKLRGPYIRFIPPLAQVGTISQILDADQKLPERTSGRPVRSPPSTTTHSPVMNSAESDTRNATVLAMLGALPGRPRGMSVIICCL